MEWFDYSKFDEFVCDEDLFQLLCLDKSFEELLDQFTQPEFLEIASGMRIPFFAETKDYQGAIEIENQEGKWLVKPIKDSKVVTSEMAMIIFFLDFFTHTLSSPVVVTKIDNVLYKATKLILRAEQLSGADYIGQPELHEQLLLDLINRWIYFDEDRNPNNYMLRQNSNGNKIVIAIDFEQADLLSKDIKIKGIAEEFGWERQEKTRYLTPLKSQNFLNYDMNFYNMRFDYFNQLDKKLLTKLCQKALRFNPEKDAMSKLIADNILKRVAYVDKYFSSHIQEVQVKSTKHRDMGKSFHNIYGKNR